MNIQSGIKQLCTGGASAINLAYVTQPKFNKRENPFYDATSKSWLIEKIGVMNGLTGVSYQNSVNNQLARNGDDADFVSKPIWNGKGQHVNQFLVKHVDNNKLYLKVLSRDNSIKIQYRWKDTKRPLTADEMTVLNRFKADADNHVVDWNLIDLENILQLTFNHQTYESEKI